MARPYESNTTGANASAEIMGQQFWGQTFTTYDRHELTSFKFQLWRTGNPTLVKAWLFATDSNQKPTGYALATSNSLDVSSIPTSFATAEWKELVFPIPHRLAKDKEYAVVLANLSSGSDGVWLLCNYDDDTYMGGKACKTLDSGVSWEDVLTDTDFMFEEWGEPITAKEKEYNERVLGQIITISHNSFTNELILGGLPVKWTPSDLTQPTEVITEGEDIPTKIIEAGVAEIWKLENGNLNKYFLWPDGTITPYPGIPNI